MKKLKLGILDIIIILTLVFALSIAIGYFGTKKNADKHAPELIFSIELKSLPNEYTKYFKNGDVLKDSVKGGVLGKVVNVDVKQNVEIREDTLNDNFVRSSFSDRADIVLSVSAVPTVFDEKDIIIHSQKIKIGEMLYFKSRDYTSNGYIIDIEIEDSGG